MKIHRIDHKKREVDILLYESDSLVMNFKDIGNTGNPRADIRNIGITDISAVSVKRKLFVARNIFIMAREMAIDAIIAPTQNPQAVTDQNVFSRMIRRAYINGRSPLDELEDYAKIATWLTPERVHNVRGLIAEAGGRASHKAALKRKEKARQGKLDLK